jgi:hypothetical protein
VSVNVNINVPDLGMSVVRATMLMATIVWAWAEVLKIRRPQHFRQLRFRGGLVSGCVVVVGGSRGLPPAVRKARTAALHARPR